MRVRCSKGLSISQFHGHFFVRSIDLLSLPQVSGSGLESKEKKRPHLSIVNLVRNQVLYQAALQVSLHQKVTEPPKRRHSYVA